MHKSRSRFSTTSSLLHSYWIYCYWGNSIFERKRFEALSCWFIQPNSFL